MNGPYQRRDHDGEEDPGGPRVGPGLQPRREDAVMGLGIVAGFGHVNPIQRLSITRPNPIMQLCDLMIRAALHCAGKRPGYAETERLEIRR